MIHKDMINKIEGKTVAKAEQIVERQPDGWTFVIITFTDGTVLRITGKQVKTEIE